MMDRPADEQKKIGDLLAKLIKGKEGEQALIKAYRDADDFS